ncbi:MAG TPA: sulfotransferase [Rudaea sp.]|nr:sulfotransferase [Rudaea sp.]
MMTLEQRLAGLPPEIARDVVEVIRAVEERRVDEAERMLRTVLPRAPAHAEVLRLAGAVHFLRGRVPQAVAALSQAADRRPGDPMIFNALGGVYASINDVGRSREALRRACEVGADFAPAWTHYGWRLFADGDVDAAVEVLKHAASLAPKDAQTRSLLADALHAEGDVAGAIAQYRAIIAEAPAAAARAWWGLAALEPVPFDAEDIDSMRAVLRGGGVSAADRTTIGGALAVALEQAGDFAGAFAALDTAQALAREAEPYDAAAFDARVDGILAAAPAAAAAPAQGDEAIFIVGMPRSGSTLVEQILTAHSRVAAGAELPDVPQLVLEESNRVRQRFPDWVLTHTSAQWRALGERYLERTAHWRHERPRLTDALPGNWLYVGAILAMLPHARIVVVRRDPLETCFACYRHVLPGHPYAHGFGDLAARWRAFDRAARHWLERYPDRVREQSYEALVADPEAQIRELLAFCDLPFEPACVEFHAGRRRVATTRAGRAREPLHRDVAARYGALLDPLRAALGLPAFDA